MKPFVFSCMAAISLVLAQGAAAQDGVFRDYDELRSTLDQYMTSRDIKSVMLRFGGADEMTIQQLDDLQGRVRQIFPQDFTEVALVRRNEMENGWAQELISYRSGISYIFAYLVLHQLDDAIVSVNFQFNTDFNDLNAQF
ncbi:hypothetical protein [Marivita geojedonensis]|uniref:DUF3887 domain-containing protein n=1 Tax=Marivita geojedonensis TaxID=1123756 RepID=A0A1X4NIJ0_9RHOB|nr:hypothetical protein [Marivita geojedonensis]OSQ48557.1 hypothetical protein MGEO_14355 [Marivita geojedonensis]PRY75099.1 hypothetical protein CLV76_1169 [Marivita geojedonensis]